MEPAQIMQSVRSVVERYGATGYVDMAILERQMWGWMGQTARPTDIVSTTSTTKGATASSGPGHSARMPRWSMMRP